MIESFYKKFAFKIEVLKNSNMIENEKEISLLYDAIKERLNKEVTGIKRLYQGTKDGDDIGISLKLIYGKINTLLIAKSNGNRRYGGFTSHKWEVNVSYIDDKNAFVFSLDKLKIYPYKKDCKAMLCYNNYFCFGNGYTSYISNNFLKEKKSHTYESFGQVSYNFSATIMLFLRMGVQTILFLKNAKFLKCCLIDLKKGKD